MRAYRDAVCPVTLLPLELARRKILVAVEEPLAYFAVHPMMLLLRRVGYPRWLSGSRHHGLPDRSELLIPDSWIVAGCPACLSLHLVASTPFWLLVKFLSNPGSANGVCGATASACSCTNLPGHGEDFTAGASQLSRACPVVLEFG